MIKTEKVPGSKRSRKIFAFTISTCAWCKKTKALLRELDVEFEYVDIDLASGAQSEEIDRELERWNPELTAPTIVIDGGKDVIIGYVPEEIRRKLG